jgi:Holliday junction resolvasome RuvABC endonuclease subunit
MTVAVLDPGRNLGVLRAPLRERAAIIHGRTLYTAKLRDTTDLGAFLRSGDDHIREAIRGVDEVWVEEANTQGQNHTGIVKNVALVGHIAYWCVLDDKPLKFFNLRNAKVALTDSGNAKKPEMIAAAEFQLGVKPGHLSEHEADVFAGWLVASFGVPVSASQRAAKAAKERRLAREAAKAAKMDPLF